METTDDIYAAIEIKSANRWMREARQKPVPKMLFGELWLEGELAVLQSSPIAIRIQITPSIPPTTMPSTTNNAVSDKVMMEFHQLQGRDQLTINPERKPATIGKHTNKA